MSTTQPESSDAAGRPPRTERLHLLVMRHAEHDDGALTEDARTYLAKLGRWLAEWRDAAWRDQPARRIEVWQAATAREVAETAAAVAEHLGTEPPHVITDPAAARVERDLAAYEPSKSTFDTLVTRLVAAAKEHPERAIVLVGNEPMVGWLARRLHGHDVAIDRGELVCLTRAASAGGSWALEWTLSADGDAQTAAILTKVSSKATTGTALGTVIVGLTAFLIETSLSQPFTGWQWLAVAALGSSAFLYFASLFLYDGLQMPSRYWGSRFPGSRHRLVHGRATLARPPTSTARVLQVAMVQIWLRIFTPATYLAGLGVVLLAVSTTAVGRSWDPAVHPLAVVLGTAGLIAVLVLWVLWNRPDLGSTD